MTDFSLNLNEDQLQIQKWVHDFAEEVVRPAAHEWDEKEEFPYPIVEQAKEIGARETTMKSRVLKERVFPFFAAYFGQELPRLKAGTARLTTRTAGATSLGASLVLQSLG